MLASFVEDNEALIQKVATALIFALLSVIFGAIFRRLQARLGRRIRDLWERSANTPGSSIHALKAWILEIIDHLRRYGAGGRAPNGDTLVDKIRNMLATLSRVLGEIFDDFDWDDLPLSGWDVAAFLFEVGLMLTPWGWMQKAAGVLAILVPLGIQVAEHAIDDDEA